MTASARMAGGVSHADHSVSPGDGLEATTSAFTCVIRMPDTPGHWRLRRALRRQPGTQWQLDVLAARALRPRGRCRLAWASGNRLPQVKAEPAADRQVGRRRGTEPGQEQS